VPPDLTRARFGKRAQFGPLVASTECKSFCNASRISGDVQRVTARMIASGKFGTEVLIHCRIHNLDCVGVGLHSLVFFPDLHVGPLRVDGSNTLQRLPTLWILLDSFAANNKLNCEKECGERTSTYAYCLSDSVCCS